MVRQPAVAGAFYPAERSRLEAMLDNLIGDEGRMDGVVAGMLPHAGYVYSGQAAGALFAVLDVPETVVLLGPNHRGLGERYGVFESGAWRTPLGDAAVDGAFAAELLKEADFLRADTASHLYEHANEVQVPFLQYLRPDVKIVPISIGDHDFGRLVALGRALAAVARSLGIEPLVLASSDMTHYEPSDEARRKDRMALERMCALDEEGLWQVVRGHGITMCGLAPAVAATVAAREMGAREGRVVKYTNSGDVTGDYAEVVGYASVAFLKETE